MHGETVLKDRDQLWWRITCLYGGVSSVAAAVGASQAEAVRTFLGSLADPHLAEIETVTLIGFGRVDDALLAL